MLQLVAGLSLPSWSKMTKRVLLVPWSIAPTNSAIARTLSTGSLVLSLIWLLGTGSLALAPWHWLLGTGRLVLAP